MVNKNGILISTCVVKLIFVSSKIHLIMSISNKIFNIYHSKTRRIHCDDNKQTIDSYFIVEAIGHIEPLMPLRPTFFSSFLIHDHRPILFQFKLLHNFNSLSGIPKEWDPHFYHINIWSQNRSLNRWLSGCKVYIRGLSQK